MRRRSRPRVTRLFATLMLVVVVLISCAPPETDPGALRLPDDTPLYADGTFRAAFSHTDPHGWRAFLSVRVRAGLIESVCFDAVDADGALLRSAEFYQERYRLATGVGLSDLFRGLEETVIERQASGFRVPVAALDWSVQFELLLRSALAAAAGARADIVELVTAGPYRAADAPDRLGWRAELVTVYGGASVVGAAFIETREQNDGTRIVKRDTEAYQAQYRRYADTDTAGVVSELVQQLVRGDTTVDSVSGATLTSARFIALSARIAALRRAAPLPRRWCR